MLQTLLSRFLPFIAVLVSAAAAQNSAKPRYAATTTYTGIEVGAKGVKMSILDVGRKGAINGDFHILKDTSVNTDFISFSNTTFAATLSGLCSLYDAARNEYGIPSDRIFTVISSGVKMQAEKENKLSLVHGLVDSFRVKINDPARQVELVDVSEEARLSHLGIVPEAKRFSTFLIDIGSGNTKGGFFPYGDMSVFRLFQLNWGTKSAANAAEKLCSNDNSLENFNRQLAKVLSRAENEDVAYAINASGSYPASDNIAVSGGIAWSVANLMHPEMYDNPVVPVTYAEMAKFCEKLYNNFDAFTPEFLAQTFPSATEREKVMKEISRVRKVFDQKSLLSGAGLLLKIMRQFTPVNETKQFFLIKNGQVGWISAYVDQAVGAKKVF